jgi:hypothetical protein
LIDGNLFVDCAQAVSFSPWGEARWLEHIQKYANSQEIDWTLYTNRYPELVFLQTNANVNYLSRNQFVNCDRTLHHNKAATLIDNWEVKGSANYHEMLTTFPATQNPSILNGIPFEQIGLHADSWRKTLPTGLIRELRSDK